MLMLVRGALKHCDRIKSEEIVKDQARAGIARRNDDEPEVDRHSFKDGKLDLCVQPAALGVFVEATVRTDTCTQAVEL